MIGHMRELGRGAWADDRVWGREGSGVGRRGKSRRKTRVGQYRNHRG